VNAFRRLLPHPATSALLLVAWLLLQGSLSPGHLVLGGVLAISLPRFTRRFWPEQVRLARPWVLLRFVAVVLWDILIANFGVARLTLASRAAIRPGFVRLALDLDNDFATTVLASTVSLTPGTVSAELSADRRHLVIHYLVCDDEALLLDTIRRRYEAPIKEIFRC